MKLLARRREVAQAERHLQHQRRLLHSDTQALRARFSRHRGAIAVGGGAALGLVCGLIPMRGLARLGRLVAGVSGFALRTPIGAMLIDAIRQAVPANKTAPGDNER